MVTYLGSDMKGDDEVTVHLPQTYPERKNELQTNKWNYFFYYFIYMIGRIDIAYKFDKCFCITKKEK